MEQGIVKSKADLDYTDTCRHVITQVVSRYGCTARITNILEILRYSFGIEEFQLFDPVYISNGIIDSYLMDLQLDWQAGKKIDLAKVHSKLLQVYDFTGNEKSLLRDGKVEERIWGILVAITSTPIEREKLILQLN